MFIVGSCLRIEKICLHDEAPLVPRLSSKDGVAAHPNGLARRGRRLDSEVCCTALLPVDWSVVDVVPSRVGEGPYKCQHVMRI